MKKFFAVLMLVLALAGTFAAPFALAQTDAGFLESNTGLENPEAWQYAAWYCIEDGDLIVSGPYQWQPSCNW